MGCVWEGKEEEEEEKEEEEEEMVRDERRRKRAGKYQRGDKKDGGVLMRRAGGRIGGVLLGVRPWPQGQQRDRDIIEKGGSGSEARHLQQRPDVAAEEANGLLLEEDTQRPHQVACPASARVYVWGHNERKERSGETRGLYIGTARTSDRNRGEAYHCPRCRGGCTRRGRPQTSLRPMPAGTRSEPQSKASRILVRECQVLGTQLTFSHTPARNSGAAKNWR